jgi:hypothetical protein
MPLVGEEVEHLLGRTRDHDLAFDLGLLDLLVLVPFCSERFDPLGEDAPATLALVHEHGALGEQVGRVVD